MPRVRQPRPRTKQLSAEGTLGQLGINLIERIVTEMGSRWNVAGPNEVGIDGYIELFEPGTGRPCGVHLAVQSKAVSRFDGDEDSVKFSCKRQDIAYWLEMSPPVLLVVSCPSSGEAYWLSVPEFFGRPENEGTTVARFDRRAQVFTSRAFDALLSVARPPDRTVIRVPVAGHETLYSNLVPLVAYPKSVFVAPATCRGYPDARARLRGSKTRAPRCWALHGSNLLSFVDPTDGVLAAIADDGAVEEHEASVWGESDDPDQRRLFVSLLNAALEDDLGGLGIRFFFDDRVYAFKGTPDRVPRKWRYQNVRQRVELTVVDRHSWTSRNGVDYEYLRHNAFRGRFRRLGSRWYLEVNPTYRFTSDGFKKYRFHADQLSGIKRLERNRAVLSQLLMWNEVLAQNQKSLFANRSRFLEFGSVERYRVEGAIPDDAWRAARAAAGDEEEGPADDDLPLLALIDQGLE